MAKSAHVQLVQSGVEATWAWRDGRLDLRDADLSGLRLRGALLDQADLRGSRLVHADLTDTRLQEANLDGAHLIRATLDNVRLGGSSLSGALLCSASLRRATLVRCNLTNANLAGADFESASLSHARFAGALLDRTKLVDADLAGASGLDQVIHQGPSELGTHALLRFGHELPANFLRGVGLSESFIRYLPAIISSSRPIDFCSVYVCAATADLELARRLYNDLQGAGIRCWLRLPSAEASGAELDHVIHLHDRSIVLCSEHSHSDVRVAAELATPSRNAARTTYLILDESRIQFPSGTVTCDFRQWRNFHSYVDGFNDLMRVLVP